MFQTENLSIPLNVNLLTPEGKLLGHFHTSNISYNGVFVDGETQELMDTIRLLDLTVCMAEIELPHRRPIRTMVRLGMQVISKNGAKKNFKVFLRFVRMNSDYKQRYDELLYANPASSL